LYFVSLDPRELRKRPKDDYDPNGLTDKQPSVIFFVYISSI